MDELTIRNRICLNFWLYAGGAALFIFSALYYLITTLPMNMDEAGIYHLLACKEFPANSLNIFREGCVGQYGLTTPFGQFWDRPQGYTGIFHSWLYLPFYQLVKAPWAQYVFGLCYFALFVPLFARLTSRPMQSAIVIASFLPFLIQFTHDMGPVKYALLTFPLMAHALIYASTATIGTQTLLGLTMALIASAGVEEKAFYVYLLPMLGFFCLAYLPAENIRALIQKIKIAAPALSLAILGTLLTIITILYSTNFMGMAYIDWLGHMRHSFVTSHNEWLKTSLNFFFFWPSFGLTFKDLFATSLLDILLHIFTGFFILWAGYLLCRKECTLNRLKKNLLIISALSGFIVFSCFRNTWAGHHYIYLTLPLIALFCELLEHVPETRKQILLWSFLGLNIMSLAAFIQAPVNPKNDAERTLITDYFSPIMRAEKSIVNYTSWGGYYSHALYGPKNQFIVYTEPYKLGSYVMDEIAAERLAYISAATNRTIYNVCYGENCNAYEQALPFKGFVEFTEVDLGLTHWHVFRATLKPLK